MAITYVGGTTGTGASANYAIALTGLTGGLASAPAEGDWVVVATAFSSATDIDGGVTTSGYTEVNERYQLSTRGVNLAVAYKLMTATPDTTVTVIGSGNAALGAASCVQVWRGVDATTPADVAPVASGGGNSATPNPPSITPVTTGAIVLIAGAYSAAAVDATFTVPTGFQTNPLNASADPGTAVHCFLAYSSTPWASGAVDAGGWGSITGVAGDAWVAISCALRPAAEVAQTRRETMNDGRGAPLGGQVVAATSTDTALEIPYATHKGIRQVGVIASADVFIDLDTSAAARANLATTGVKVPGGTPSVEYLYQVRHSQGRVTYLHLATATTASVHLNWYQ